MRVEGRIVQWDDAKGYGFIAPSSGGPKIFAHARAFGLRPRRPFVGERVSYEPGTDAQGKPRALKVLSLEPKPQAAATAGAASSAAGGRSAKGRGASSRASGAGPRASAGAAGAGGKPGASSRSSPGSSSASSSSSSGGVWLIPVFASLVLLTHLAWPIPNGLWGLYMAMSLATFIVYGLDKRAARLGHWRVKESTLHGLALLCGWPGALLAQQLLRHKSAKPRFRRVFWLSVSLNILGFVLVFTPLLSPLLSPWMAQWRSIGG
ncbi:DUF1294 domain-containing protein [Roseateles amylovorans]|uniref:DUF1294 domain-containing protein n=1 Tax=Roseateles amylovorans TaxID=2978473 RepID=A0ABY6AUN2_9BURK|nr:DUF1294 domain-containing protein [Roseateles amylovorans]UXH76382.1 DUF1294 domain-containing protein [Roseateles amylovorans]